MKKQIPRTHRFNRYICHRRATFVVTAISVMVLSTCGVLAYKAHSYIVAERSGIGTPIAADPAALASGALGGGGNRSTDTTVQGSSAGGSTTTAAPAAGSATTAKPTTAVTPSTATSKITAKAAGGSNASATSGSGTTGTTTTTTTTTTSTAGDIASEADCPGQSSIASTQTVLVCMTNFARRADGVGSVSANSNLMTSAGHKAIDIKNCGFSHTACGHDFNYWITADGYTGACVAENIAMGQATPGEVFVAWMNSAGHRANILHTSYTDIGVAELDSGSGPIWVMHLGNHC